MNFKQAKDLSPLLKQQANDLPPPLLKRQGNVLKYNKRLLQSTFPSNMLENVTVNDTFTPRGMAEEYTFKYLRDNLILKVNEGRADVTCYLTTNKALALFNVRVEDVDILNNLLTYLMEKLNIDTAYHPSKMEALETLFIRPERLTTYFDKDWERINKLPNTCFNGNVVLKVMGLQLHSPKKNGMVKTVKLLIHLEQVRVVEENCVFVIG